MDYLKITSEVNMGSTLYGVGGKNSLAPFLCLKIENK